MCLERFINQTNRIRTVKKSRSIETTKILEICISEYANSKYITCDDELRYFICHALFHDDHFRRACWALKNPGNGDMRWKDWAMGGRNYNLEASIADRVLHTELDLKEKLALIRGIEISFCSIIVRARDFAKEYILMVRFWAMLSK